MLDAITAFHYAYPARPGPYVTPYYEKKCYTTPYELRIYGAYRARRRPNDVVGAPS